MKKSRKQAKQWGAKNQRTRKKTPNGGEGRRKQKIRFSLDGKKFAHPHWIYSTPSDGN
jgi:hypothetical protein